MDKAREIAEEIVELFRQPHIDAGTPLEDVHLVESIADIIDSHLDAEYKDGVNWGEGGEQNPRCFA